MENEYHFTLGENSSSSQVTGGVMETAGSHKDTKFIFSNVKEAPKNSYTNIVKNKSKKSSSTDETKVTPNRKKSSEKNKKNLPLQPNRSIGSVKNSLYEALKNINKELNVKIEKKDRDRMSYSLLNFIDQDPDDMSNSEEGETKEIIEKKEDGFARKQSKKIDLDSVLESFVVDHQKQPKETNFEFFNNNFTSSIDDLTEENSIEIKPEHPKERTEIIEEVNYKQNEIIIEPKDKDLFSALKDEGIILPQENFDYTKLFQFIRRKNEEINKLTNQITFCKQETEIIKENSIKTEQKLTNLENDYKQLQNYSVRIEKENIILKSELGNAIKHKHSLIKKFNDELADISRLSQTFYENFNFKSDLLTE